MSFYTVCRSILRGAYAILYRFEARGLENIPSVGPVVLASNHLSILDPITVGIPIDRQINFMAKEELFEKKWLGPLIRKLGAFPVKRSNVSTGTIRAAIDVLKAGGVFGIFPEGTRNLPVGSPIKRGAAMIGVRGNATIVPVAIVGKYRLFRKMKVYYGKPVDVARIQAEYTGSAVMDQVTEVMMAEIRGMLKEG
jgi:1-acyl-sn-glycerol-3-phosphate acyltransferase